MKTKDLEGASSRARKGIQSLGARKGETVKTKALAFETSLIPHTREAKRGSEVHEVVEGKVSRVVGSLPKGTRRVYVQRWVGGVGWIPSIGSRAPLKRAVALAALAAGPLAHERYRLVPVIEDDRMSVKEVENVEEET